MFDYTRIPETHFDWQASLQLMNGKEAVSRELAIMLRDSLPDFATKLKAAIEKNNTSAIQITAHKLHGGLCYVAAPRLKYLISHLEVACKQHPEKIHDIAHHVGPSIDALQATLNQFFK